MAARRGRKYGEAVTELTEDEEFWMADSIHWGAGVTFASLDVVAPLTWQLGLALPATWTRDSLRGAIAAYREESARSERVIFVRPFLAEQLADVDEWATLSAWVDDVFSLHDHDLVEWCSWQEAFTVWSRRPHDPGVALALPTPTEPIHAHYLEALDLRPIENQLAAQRDKPRSDWDVECFARMGWFPGEPYTDPFELVLRTAATHRFQEFCARLAETLPSATDHVRLRSSAIAILNARGHTWTESELPTLQELLQDPSA